MQTRQFTVTALLIVVATLLAASAASAAVLVVNHADDYDDGGCTAAHCSLREAINLANLLPTADEIFFDIAGPSPHEISLDADLPWIEDTILIEGGTQPNGGPGIGIVHPNAGSSSPILHIDAPGCQIRGLALEEAPIGIFVDNFGDESIIEGNWIGLRVDGAHPVYMGSGIELNGTNDVHIGGPEPHQRNVIAGYRMWGINAYSSSLATPTVDRTVIQGNYIGTDPSGQFTAGADDPPGHAAIALSYDVVDTLIGGDGPGEGNLIAGSAGLGIEDLGYSSVILGNTVGVNVNGDPLPNGESGLYLGGCYAFVAQNVIAYNGAYALEKGWCRHGITVVHKSGCPNQIIANSIHDNVGLGIALGDCHHHPPLPNDPLDADSGENYLQNYPTILSAYVDAQSYTQIQLHLNSVPWREFDVDLYASRACDPSGYGEGEVMLHSLVLSTDGFGNAGPVWVTLPWEVSEGWYITATATSDEAFPKGTSEFGPCRRLDPLPR